MPQRLDQIMGTDRLTTTTAVAEILMDLDLLSCPTDGMGWTDCKAGLGTLGRTLGSRLKLGFAKVGILAIVEAGHQPRDGEVGLLLLGQGDPRLGGSNHSRIGSHVDAVGSGQGIEHSQIAHRAEVLKTSSTDELEPGAVLQGIRWQGH